MKIQIIKKTHHQSHYAITRNDGSVEEMTLDTKTYFLHDICHYVVEKNLSIQNGFWGMLSHGYTFQQLFGKDNPLTTELRFIEQIVGPVQSVYSGHIPENDFEQFIAHLYFPLPENMLSKTLAHISSIMEKWQPLEPGQSLNLDWS